MEQEFDIVGKSLEVGTKGLDVARCALERAHQTIKTICIVFALVCAMQCAVIITLAAFYFFADYGYPDPPSVEQTQTNTQTVTGGGAN